MRESLLVVVLLGGCAPVDPSPAQPSPSQAPPAGEATAGDLALAHALVAWARTGDPASLDRPTFAHEVALGLGQEIVAWRTFDALSDPMGWRLDRDVFRGRGGPFSALDQLRPDGDVVVSVGPHRHCASPPLDPPPGLEDHRRLSIQPASTSSCLRWWTVDLFLGEDGRIEAVTLDFFEP